MDPSGGRARYWRRRGHADPHADAHQHADTHADGHQHTNAHADGYQHADTDANRNGHTNRYPIANAKSDGDHCRTQALRAADLQEHPVA